MNGAECPRCGGQQLILSTANRFLYACDGCDIRYDYKGELMPPMDELTARDLFPSMPPVSKAARRGL